MKTLDTLLMTTGLLALGCSGQPAQAGATTPAVPALATSLVANAAPIVNTGYITTPALVSAGMTQIEAYVPTTAGATYAWSVSNGTLPGVTQNAMVYYDALGAGTVTLTCAVKVGTITTTYVQAIPVVAAAPLVPVRYGPGLSADALANTVVGGPSANVVSLRFQAATTAPLDAIRVFFIWSATELGYAAGQGGTIRVDLLADDGSAAHNPAGAVLATTDITNIIGLDDYYPRIAFAHPAALKAGTLYHLVFTDIAATPGSNYISLDSLYTDAQTAPMQPVVADAACAVLYKSGTGAWKQRPGFTPIVELDYPGASQGNGYMEVWSTNPKPISGAASVREVFVVSGGSRSFSKVLVRLERTSGTGPLAVRVEEGDGALVAQVAVPASAFLAGVSNWVTVAFPQTYVLNNGIAYHLVLSSAAGTVYSAYPLRRGQDKGFSASTVFPDGYAQFTATGASGWTGWNMWGTPDLTDSDLQFAFVP